MLRGAGRALVRALRGTGAAIRAHPKAFGAVAAGVLLVNLLLPPLVLSLARKPLDYFTFNPWLRRLPEYLASNAVPLERKLEALPKLALFWFSADSLHSGTEWGFAVDAVDLLRFVLTSLLFGAFFALWLTHRDRVPPRGWGASASRQGGVLGALMSVLGFSTGPCSVMGCGAPVIPVVGLAFTGLSSGTLSLLAQVSRVATGAVLVGMTLGVGYLGWRVGDQAGEPVSRAAHPMANRTPSP